MSYYGGTPPPPAPAYGGGGAQGPPPPPNYLVWAILSTILCCPPLSIPSIVFSTRVNSMWAMGDVAGAQDASEKAKNFAMWSAIAGVISSVLVIILLFAGILSLATLFGTANSVPTTRP